MDADRRVVARLIRRDECLGKKAVFAWSCFCYDCAANVLATYRESPKELPHSIRVRVEEAVKETQP